MGRNNIFMPLKYRRRFESWEAEKAKAILLAMFEYKETGEVRSLLPQYNDAFEAIRDDMDIIDKAYEERCRINAINGAKGGKAKKANAAERCRTLADADESGLKRREAKKIEEKIREDKRFFTDNRRRGLGLHPIGEYLP